MTRLDICFCSFCGSEKVSWEQFRIRCSACGRLFEVKEIVLLQVGALGD